MLHQDINSPGSLEPKTQAKLHLCWKQSMKLVVCSNIFLSSLYKTFQCDNGPEFKSKVTKLLKKHNVDIRRATTKHKHTHRAFVEAFKKELAKLLFKPMDAQELQNPEKVSTIWVKHLNKTVNKMNNTVWSMTGMKPKDAIKLGTVPLDKTYPNETILPEGELYKYVFQPGEKHGDQKRQEIHVIWSKNTYRLDRIVQDPGNWPCTICRTDLLEPLYVKN